jgi:hypothetical protein
MLQPIVTPNFQTIVYYADKIGIKKIIEIAICSSKSIYVSF